MAQDPNNHSTLDLAHENGYFAARAMAERLERIQDAILSGKVKLEGDLLQEVLDLDAKLGDLG